MESIISRALVPTLDTAETVIDELRDDLPAHSLSDHSQFMELVVRCLLSRRDPRIDRNPLVHAAKGIPETCGFGTLSDLFVTP
jgi:hypothetical protein